MPLTVCVVLAPGAVHLPCLVDAQEELVGRVKASQPHVALQVIVTASVSLQRPRAVDAAGQHLQGLMAHAGRTGP